MNASAGGCGNADGPAEEGLFVCTQGIFWMDADWGKAERMRRPKHFLLPTLGEPFGPFAHLAPFIHCSATSLCWTLFSAQTTPNLEMPPNDVKTHCSYLPAYSRLDRFAFSRPASWGPSVGGREETTTPTPTTMGQQQKCRGGGRRGSNSALGAVCDPVRAMDEQLARLREAPVTMSNSPGKFELSIDMDIFRPEDIEVLMSVGRLVVVAEREVRLDANTSVVRRFRRRISIPEEVNTDAVALHVNGRGILTITALKRARG